VDAAADARSIALQKLLWKRHFSAQHFSFLPQILFFFLCTCLSSNCFLGSSKISGAFEPFLFFFFTYFDKDLWPR
jgi:hypothetical protein